MKRACQLNPNKNYQFKKFIGFSDRTKRCSHLTTTAKHDSKYWNWNNIRISSENSQKSNDRIKSWQVQIKQQKMRLLWKGRRLSFRNIWVSRNHQFIQSIFNFIQFHRLWYQLNIVSAWYLSARTFWKSSTIRFDNFDVDRCKNKRFFEKCFGPNWR